MIGVYNEQVNGFILAKRLNLNLKVEDFIDSDSTKLVGQEH